MTEAPVVYCPECKSAQPHMYIAQDGGVANLHTFQKAEFYECQTCGELIYLNEQVQSYFEQFSGEEVKHEAA